MRNDKRLPDAELEVMQTIWSLGTQVTAAEVQQHADKHSYGEALCLIGEYVTITDIGDYNHNRRGKEKDNYER